MQQERFKVQDLEKITVIIPCYNREKTIRRCLDSLLEQSLPKQLLEIVVVDDGSTDQTVPILMQYESRYPEIIILVCMEQNSGGCVGAVRNVGLSYATGSYVFFMDSDDTLPGEALQLLLEKAIVFRADVVDANYAVVKNGAISGRSNKKECILNNIMAQEERSQLLMIEATERAVWGKLFRREFLIKHTIRFPENIHLGEDSFFHGMTLLYAKNYIVTSDLTYYYNIQTESIWNGDKVRLYMTETYNVIAMLWNYCKQNGLGQYQQEMEWHAYVTIFNIVEKCNKINDCKLKKEVMQTIRNAVKNDFYEMEYNPMIYCDKSMENRMVLAELFADCNMDKRLDTKIYILADCSFYGVKEPGYETVLLDEICSDSSSLSTENDTAALPDGSHAAGIESDWDLYKRVLYHIWKNNQSLYLGICLYNYYFVENGRLLSMKGLEKKLEKNGALFPDKKPSMDHMKGGREPAGLVMLVQKRWFDRYCEWLFSNKNAKTPIFEWLQEKQVRIGCQRAERIDTGRMPRMYQMIEDLTKDLIANYRGGRILKLPKLDMSVGAGGKMPVWICWLQGEDNAPDIVKKCMQSIRRSLPKEKTDIRVVTFDNYGQYVAFSDTIVKRFNEGKLSLTHLSDVLRAQLLCRYGGLWIDATCMLWDDRFVDDLLQYPFYTRKKGGEINELDIVSGRWATYFLKGPANFSLFGFLVEAFEAYWEKYDTLLNYFIFDYIIAVAYDHLTDVKMILDALPANNAASEVLADWCNEPYDENKMKLLTNQTWLFKMTYKKEFTEKTPQGEDTFYHVVINH